MKKVINESSAISKRARFSRLAPLAAALLAAGCATADNKTAAPAQPPGIVDVKVYFDGACPKYVDKWTIDVDSKPPQRVRWTAYNLDGSSTKTKIDYDIYFDPFVGPDTGNTKQDGTVTSQPISSKVPVAVTYKYTILAEGCDTGLDPLIRVL